MATEYHAKYALRRGKSGIYIGETGENMHVRMKSHLTKFNSKQSHIRESSAFFKYLQNTHGGLQEGQDFADCFFVEIVRRKKQPYTLVELSWLEEESFPALRMPARGPRGMGSLHHQAWWLEDKTRQVMNQYSRNPGDPAEEEMHSI